MFIDRKYIRTCAVYKLINCGKIKSKKTALCLLEQVHGSSSQIYRTLEIWMRYNPKWDIRE